jgi:hypothetical protein
MGSGPNAGVLDIVLERLSTDEERATLIKAFMEKGRTSISKSKDGKTVELENYGISPVALKNIKLQK